MDGEAVRLSAFRGNWDRIGAIRLRQSRETLRPSQCQVIGPSPIVLRLPNEMIMLVGRDLGEPERFRAVVRRALMAALGMMGLGALAIWYFVGRRALKRIDSVSVASAPHHGRRSDSAAAC